MTLGLPIDQASINQRAAVLAIGLRDALEACRRFKVDFLDNTNIIPNDAFLTSLSPAFTQAEVNTLRAAFGAAKKLSDIANALDVQAATSNFLVDLRKICGTVT